MWEKKNSEGVGYYIQTENEQDDKTYENRNRYKTQISIPWYMYNRWNLLLKWKCYAKCNIYKPEICKTITYIFRKSGETQFGKS